MNAEKEQNRIRVNELEFALRPADEGDIGFCYELMSHHMKVLFDKNTPERWSRMKFRSGFKPHRITIVEHERMPVGFYDCELVGDELYWHNIQLSEDYQNGVGTQIIELLEQTAENYGAHVIIGKVFAENSGVIKWLQKFGYNLDKRIEEENSYWVRKDLRRIR